MSRYDINFIGHLCIDQTLQDDGSWSKTWGGAAVYGAMAAASLDKRVSVQLKLSDDGRPAIRLLEQRGVDVRTILATQTTQVRVSHVDGSVDDRRVVTVHHAGDFVLDEVEPIRAAHTHLAGCNDHEFGLEFIRAVRQTAANLSIDMQCFVRFNDPAIGEMTFAPDSQAEAVVTLMDNVKLDVVEARLLCGTDDPDRAADTIQAWGCPEVMITRADGAFVRCGGESAFERFTNNSSAGRTGRGDTTFGAYLAARCDRGPAAALKYAAALVSLKMEQPAPFTGTHQDVLDRIKEAYQ